MKKLVMAAALTIMALQGAPDPASAMPLMPKPAPSQNTGLILAQASDPQEQIRILNGRIEEMSFQILQLQEQLRKTQEDNEFRFQQLEKGGKKTGALEPPMDGQDQNLTASGDLLPDAEAPAGLDTGDPAVGQPAVDLGAITDPATETETASLTDGSEIAYQSAYEQILAGDYGAADVGFADYITQYPQGAKIADAYFWLGEAQYSQQKYSQSAKTFLSAYKKYAKSARAPEMLLKLAMSLAALENKDTACATLREVTKIYPKAAKAISTKVASEQERLSC